MFGDEIICPTSKVIDKRLVGGAALFGIGWGLLGVCPGPAVASILTGNAQVLLFIAAMLVGSFTAKKVLQR
ncbi:hypothetical protein VA249_33930 [Vibrio alfacsensis]|nr:hypothetical protein VA249_33930 [Vibrio alfacsensis]